MNPPSFRLTLNNYPLVHGAESDGCMTAPTVEPSTRPALRFRLLHDDRLVRRLAGVTLVNTLGNGLSMTLAVLFFTRVLGYGATQVGIALTAAGLCGVLAGVPAGRAADRYGTKPVLIALVACQAVGTAAYTLVHAFPVFVVLACLVTTVDRGSATVRNAMYAQILPSDRRVEGRAYLRSVTNVGIGVGTCLAALALQADTRAAYTMAILADAVSFLVVLVLYAVVIPAPTRKAGQARPEVGGPNPALRNLPYLAVTALNGLLCLQFAMIEVGVPLWIVRETAAPRWMVSGGLVVNTVLVVLLQVRATRGTEQPAVAARVCGRGGLLLAASCAVLALAHGLPAALAALVLMAGVGLQALGEVFSQAGGWALSYDLAAEGKHGAYQGVFNTGQSAAMMLGPAVIAWLVVGHGLLGWTLLAALFAVSGLLMTLAVRCALRAA